MRQVVQSVSDGGASVLARRVARSPLTIAIVVAAFIGLTGGFIVARAGSDDRVVVGNTGGTLSGVIRVNGTNIVVGGGNSRNDLADLVGRSTLPWQRSIDLLIVPGWDNQQPLGAIDLIERGGVRQIVVVGVPVLNPAWSALESAAARAAIPVNVVSGHQVVKIATGVRVDLLADQANDASPDQFAIVTLRFHQSSLMFVDASSDGATSMQAYAALPAHAHIVVAMRPLTSAATTADLLLQPAASKSSDIGAIGATYASELPSGKHVTIHLYQDELRLPLSAVTAVPAGTP